VVVAPFYVILLLTYICFFFCIFKKKDSKKMIRASKAGLPRLPSGIAMNDHTGHAAPANLRSFGNGMAGGVNQGKGIPGRVKIVPMKANARKVRGDTRFFNITSNGRTTINRILDLSEYTPGDHQVFAPLILVRPKIENMSDLELEHPTTGFQKGFCIGRYNLNMRNDKTWRSTYGPLLESTKVTANFEPPRFLITDPHTWETNPTKPLTQAIALVGKGKIERIPNYWLATGRGVTDRIEYQREGLKCWWMHRRYKMNPLHALDPDVWKKTMDKRLDVVEAISRKKADALAWMEDPDQLFVQMADEGVDLQPESLRNRMVRYAQKNNPAYKHVHKIDLLLASAAIPTDSQIESDFAVMVKNAKMNTHTPSTFIDKNRINSTFNVAPYYMLIADEENEKNVKALLNPSAAGPKKITNVKDLETYAWGYFPWCSYDPIPPPACLWNGEYSDDPNNRYTGEIRFSHTIDVPRDGQNGIASIYNAKLAQRIIFPETTDQISSDEYNSLPKTDVFVGMGYSGPGLC